MSELTDIYVDTVTQHLPENSRDDIAAEITATINDMVEDRLGEGGPVTGDRPTNGDRPTDSDRTATVEREVLEELGDPALLSREYSNAPQYLIGPKSYPIFIWSLRWVLPAVAVLSILTNVVVHIATTPTLQLGALLGQTIGSTITALLTAFAVITILIGLGERNMDGGATEKLPGARSAPWTVDDLHRKDVKSSQTRAEAVLNLVFIVLLALIPLIPTSLVYVGHLNNGETFINPDLGTGWLLGYWGFLVLMAGIEVTKLARSSTSAALLIGGVVLDLAMAVFLTVALLTQQVIHPDLSNAGSTQVQQIIMVVAIWAIVIWDQISTWRAHRADR